MRRILLFFLVLILFGSCDIFPKTPEEPQMMDFTASDITGAWEIVEAGQVEVSGYSQSFFSDPANRSYFVFWENGRFESYGYTGYVTEGYWKIDEDGIRVNIGEEPYTLFQPLSSQDGMMTFRIRAVDDYAIYPCYGRIKCKQTQIPEFCLGYGSKPVESFFPNESDVKAYLDAIYTEFNAFESLLDGVRVKYNAPVADSLIYSGIYYSPEIDYLWKSVNTVLMRTNQGIDALQGNAALKMYADNMLGIRAINAFRMACCWGSCTPYWEHASAASAYPLDTSIADILDSAARDLASDDVYSLSGSGYLTAGLVSSIRNDIITLQGEATGAWADWGCPRTFLYKWGFNTEQFRLVLTIPYAVLCINWNQPQTPNYR